VLLQHGLVFHIVQVGVDDHRAVERDGDPPAVRDDLFRVPFPDGF